MESERDREFEVTIEKCIRLVVRVHAPNRESAIRQLQDEAAAQKCPQIKVVVIEIAEIT